MGALLTSVRHSLHQDWQLIGRIKAEVKRGLFVLIGVGDKTGEQVDHDEPFCPIQPSA